MKFSDIVGQQQLKEHLVRSVDSGRISHAQLFSGAAGAGTLPLAVAYAQYIHCRNRQNGDSCRVPIDVSTVPGAPARWPRSYEASQSRQTGLILESWTGKSWF